MCGGVPVTGAILSLSICKLFTQAGRDQHSPIILQLKDEVWLILVQNNNQAVMICDIAADN